MSEFDILDNEEPQPQNLRERTLFRDVVWIWEIPSSKMVAIIAQAVRKQLDTVENYAQFVARRLQESGVVLDVQTSMNSIQDGYILTITFRVRGVRRDVLKKRLRPIKKLAGEWTRASKEYRHAEELLRRLTAYELEDRDSSSRHDLQEVAGEGAEGESEDAGSYTESYSEDY
ncbi:hypothetical protein DRN86_04905 [Candidatus Geothermarchaeota archaeon]|nr:MAG: hypothetical protein DRN86_04905 [Candidatus Geothermarchaeota archaeon]